MNRRSILALGAAAVLSPNLASAAARGRPWRTLFDGRTLRGWTPSGEAKWRVEDRALVADGGNGFLVSNESFGDVEFRAEVWLDDKANSGVFVRCTNPLNVSATNAYEYNIWDARPDPTYGTGGIVNVAKAMNPPKTAGRWTLVEILAQGDHLVMKLDGKTTADGKDPLHAHGRFALQCNTGQVKFRNIRARAL